MLRFYRLDENIPLASFARALAQRQAPQTVGAEALAEQRDAWRHPLVEELSKDAYNFLAEFQALIESEAFDEAARMIAAAEPHAGRMRVVPLKDAAGSDDADARLLLLDGVDGRVDGYRRRVHGSSPVLHRRGGSAKAPSAQVGTVVP